MSYDCACDYDAPTFYSRNTPTARKMHRCEECSCEILPGEKYENVSGLWEGYFSTFKTCERCVDLRQWVKNNVPCFCWAHGNLTSDMDQAIAEAAYRAGDEVRGLRFGYARRIFLIHKFNSARRAALNIQQRASE